MCLLVADQIELKIIQNFIAIVLRCNFGRLTKLQISWRFDKNINFYFWQQI